MTSTAGKKVAVQDRLEIMELFARYAWGLNTGDADAVVACFAEDGFLEHLPQGRFHGQDIRRLLDHLWYDKAGWFIGRQHLANHFIMTPEGDDIRVKAMCSMLQHNVDYRTNFVFGLASWDNLCRKQHGEWKFQEVVVCKWMGDGIPWVGEDRARTLPTSDLGSG